jgi:hypothetical protein
VRPIGRNERTDDGKKRIINTRTYLTVISANISYGNILCKVMISQYKQTPWPLVREQTIPTERQPLVDEI